MKIKLNRLKHVGIYQTYAQLTLPNGMTVDSWKDTKTRVPYGVYVPSYTEQLNAEGDNESLTNISILVRHNVKLFDLTNNTYAIRLEDGKSYEAMNYVPTELLNGFDRITLKRATS